MDPPQVARQLIAAFSAGDMAGMRRLLADDLRAYITNRDGGVDEVAGADGYVARVQAMDLASADFRVDITQLVTVRQDLVLVMVEIHAARAGRSLHNHAAHLLLIPDGAVAEWWMVEALPADSDEFWSATR
ncbi:MAG TPA: nuclear transport factor 2 family protein [Solirubrobacteraceae bacterium]|nr:nuclear transport factor 2 family protein [Solirubrobacteraceae bacterium]